MKLLDIAEFADFVGFCARAGRATPEDAYAERALRAEEATEDAEGDDAAHGLAAAAHYSARAFARRLNDGAAVDAHSAKIREHEAREREHLGIDDSIVRAAWNPDQPRDDRGRFAPHAGVAASREASALSGMAGVFGDAADHRAASEAHSKAATLLRALGEKHLEVGNHGAAEKYAAMVEHHESHAASHAAEAAELEPPPKPPKPAKEKKERKPVSEARSSGARRAAEKRRQNDDFAKQNIPDHLHPLWDRMKGGLKGTPHERAEKLLEYAEENPHDAIEATILHSERKLAGLLRAHVRSKAKESAA